MLMKLYTKSIVIIVQDYNSIKTHSYNKLRLPFLSIIAIQSLPIFKIGNPIHAKSLCNSWVRSLNTSSVAFCREYSVARCLTTVQSGLNLVGDSTNGLLSPH